MIVPLSSESWKASLLSQNITFNIFHCR
jgi:hypothetical protein